MKKKDKNQKPEQKQRQNQKSAAKSYPSRKPEQVRLTKKGKEAARISSDNLSDRLFENEIVQESLPERNEMTSLPRTFINRELSWLEFNDRVLEEARDKQNPLLERLRFLAITASNLDEFFMIRVASLKDLVDARYQQPDPAGLTPAEQLGAISKRTHLMVQKQYSTLNRILLPALNRQDIRIMSRSELNEEQQLFINDYFKSTVFPILTPMAVDAARPFPLISNKSLNLCVRVEREDMADLDSPDCDPDDGVQPDFAIIQIPSVVPRLLQIPDTVGQSFVLLEDIVLLNLDKIFNGVRICSAACFRIMRNADLDLDEEDAADLLKSIEKQLKMRQWGQVIRMEVEVDFDPAMMSVLVRLLRIEQNDIYTINGPLDLTLLRKMAGQINRSDLNYLPYEAPASPELAQDDVFAVIRRQDILLHHPYESFDPVIDFIRTATKDPDVLAIKQTLYRVSGNSPIVSLLAEAAEMGKQVMVLVELKARFDEENNIHWARKLEQAGCHVIYGLVGLKTHSKITLVVRRDEDGIRRYVHLGTGNYNDITAGIYADFGLLTCSESIGVDATEFFNMLSGYSAPLSWRKLVPAPIWLRREIERRIEQEKLHAKAGKPARIIAKVNSLVDEGLIDALYQASQAGVEIDLIVRGICCLRPGIPGLSDHIRVRSIIGRFLEHSRIFYFYNDGQQDLFLSSADWMTRNLDRRVELMFPIEDARVWQRIHDVLQLQLADTNRSWLMQPDGSYQKVDRRGKTLLDCQEALCQEARLAASEAAGHAGDLAFTPVERIKSQEAD